MRQILNIFINDLRAVGRQFFAIVIMLAICILPALYAWFNIYANTDPYGSTKNIAIAVASDDPGVTLDDGSYVNMAQEVMDDLAAKTTIHWIVTDSVQEAIDGVYAGDTYAAVILSEDFTARMTDLSTAVSSGGAGMTYYENGKKNAVASKITQTAVTSLQQDVRAKYLGNLFSQLYSDTTELTGSANIAQAAGQVSQHIAALRAKLRTYSNVIGNILGDSVALDQLTQGGGLTFEGADTWQQQIENSTALLSQVQEQSGQAASALTGSLEDLESALQQAAKGDQAALTDAAQAAKDAQTKVQNIRSVLAHLSRLDGVSQTLTLLDTAELHLQQIRTVIEDKAVTNEQIETCLEAMPNLEKLAAGEIRADLEQIAGGVKNAATDVQPLLKAMETMKQDIVPAIDAVQGSKDDAVAALGCLQVVLGGLADRMDELSKLAAACSSSDLLHQLDTALSGDASRFGAFLASPVEVESETVYPVKNYGTAMTPFYSVLAIWVGGVILVALIQVHPDRKKFPTATDNQCYFGRLLLFLLIGQLQAAVIVLGDIYLLKCQCLHPGMLFLAAGLASFTFVTLIYSLTVSFGDIGKAIVVVVMVVQIAGSSGSYPIEILPEIFEKIYRFFPFPYAINAMREAICGTYEMDYAVYLLELLIFAVLALCIGLLVRKPFIGTNHFVSEKLEETELM